MSRFGVLAAVLAGCVASASGKATACPNRHGRANCTAMSSCSWQNSTGGSCQFKSQLDKYCYTQPPEDFSGDKCASACSWRYAQGGYCATQRGTCPDAPQDGSLSWPVVCAQAGCNYTTTRDSQGRIWGHCEGHWSSDDGSALAAGVIAVIVLCALCCPLAVAVGVCFFCGFLCFSGRRQQTTIVHQPGAPPPANYSTMPQGAVQNPV